MDKEKTETVKTDKVENEKKTELVKKIPSPYDLYANDNPGNLITHVQLKGENYDEWAKAMRTSLRARRKWRFVEGDIPQLERDSPEIEDWWTVQSMLVAWVLNTIETSLRSTISYQENVKDLWEDIKERFSAANGPRGTSRMSTNEDDHGSILWKAEDFMG
ncbi:Gag-polypeptide of LTR copia-type [Sesbania bispinosa]|nr:Gag-polypeptide of LTR copia-type [Sesbania bispinosa]